MPVRDHYPRWLMCMYYPTDTTLEMGPTCEPSLSRPPVHGMPLTALAGAFAGVVPGSHYYEVDRLQWGTLYTDAEMPETNANGEQDAWKKEVDFAQQAMQGSDAEVRTSLTEKAGSFFKSTASDGKPAAHMACTCPAGSIALIHFDILHRGSRQYAKHFSLSCLIPQTHLAEQVLRDLRRRG